MLSRQRKTTRQDEKRGQENHAYHPSVHVCLNGLCRKAPSQVLNGQRMKRLADHLIRIADHHVSFNPPALAYSHFRIARTASQPPVHVPLVYAHVKASPSCQGNRLHKTLAYTHVATSSASLSSNRSHKSCLLHAICLPACQRKLAKRHQ